MTLSKKINIYQWHYNHDLDNFGDVLSVPIINKLLKKREFAVEHDDISSADALIIGSLLQVLNDELNSVKNGFIVCGSGLIKGGSSLNFRSDLNIISVRGRLTLEKLDSKYNTGNISTGDPGIISDLLVKKPLFKKYKLGILPHYVDMEHPWIKSAESNGIKIISPLCRDPLDVIKEISKCKTVLSSSLHGLIVADSFGIKNRQIILSDKITGGQFKYDDYYSSYKIRPTTYPLDLSNKKTFKMADIENHLNNIELIPASNTNELKSRVKKSLIEALQIHTEVS